MCSQGVMSSKEASNSPGLCLVKGQKSGVCSWTRAQNHFLSLSVGIDKTPPHYICWLSLQDFIFLLTFCLGTPKAGSGWTHFWTVPFLVSLLAVSFPCTPECPATQNSPTVWWVEVSFSAFWYSCSNGEVVLAAWWAYRATWLLEQMLMYFSDLSSGSLVACVSFKATK